MGRIRRDRANRMQMETIVKAMEMNSNLNRQTLSSKYSIAERQRDWSALCEILNKDGEVGGAVKPVIRWQKCWSDYKSEVKKRYRAVLNSQRMYLSPLEQRVIKLMGINPEINLDNPESQSFELEISKVESLQDISSSKTELEESRTGLSDPESSNSMSMIPEEYITLVKIEPEEMPKRLPEANDSTHSVNLASDSSSISLVPATHSDMVTLTSESSNIYIVPEPIPVSKPPAVNNRINIFSPAIGESSGEGVVKVQSASTQTFQSDAKDLETVAEIKKDLKTIAEAFKSFAKAFETMTENQKTQLAIEERRTALFEKLINHFCS